MESKLEELERRRKRLAGQVDGSGGDLQIELLSVKEKLSRVSVDLPTDDVIALQQQEAALALRIASGEAELQRVKDEIAQLKYFESQQMQGELRARQLEKERVGEGQARISEIDALLNGTKPFSPIPIVMVNDRPSDPQHGHIKRLHNLKLERARLVGEFGSPEEHAAAGAKERIEVLEAMFAGKRQFPELSYAEQDHARRFDMTGKDGYLVARRKDQRRALEGERDKLIASIGTESSPTQLRPDGSGWT